MSLFSSVQRKKVSDQSRSGRYSRFLAPLIGLAAGLFYGFLEWWFDQYGEHGPALLWNIHETFDFIVPIGIGVLTGIGARLFYQNTRLNESLSTQNHHLRSRLLANTLLAHILHEIRNPVHNLSALLEKNTGKLEEADRVIAERNLQRLNTVTDQLKRMNSPWDEINSRERTNFTHWLHDFIQQSVRSSLTAHSIHYEETLRPFIAHMHPLLLEQCWTILFQNAIQACLKSEGRRQISLSAQIDPVRHGFASVIITNSGELLPDYVLQAGARKSVRSQTGLGIGLLLARDTLETAGGSLEISNQSGRATIHVLIPAESTL